MDSSDTSPGQSIIGRLASAFSKSPDTLQDANGIATNATSTPSPAEIRLRINEFERLRVEDVMIPRAEIVAVEEQTALSDLVRLFADTTHSRLVVYRETLDDPIGIVHIKDLVSVLADQSDKRNRDSAETTEEGDDVERRPLTELRRDLLYVPPSMRLPDLMLKMQSKRMHLALVVDEYGGTDGLVSLEDLVEQIVGEIEDEHDDDVPYITARGRGIWDVDARTEIEDFADESGLDMSLPEYEDEIDTLGGVVFAIVGRIPQRGEIIRHLNGVDMEIVEADSRRIRRIRVRSAVDTGSKQVQSGSEKPATH